MSGPYLARLYPPYQPGDPDKAALHFDFWIDKSLTTSELILTDPDGVEHVCADWDASARVVGDWCKGRGF